MHPILLQLGPIPIHTYGFLIAIGFLVAVAVIKRPGRPFEPRRRKILDLTFCLLAVGFLGARIVSSSRGGACSWKIDRHGESLGRRPSYSTAVLSQPSRSRSGTSKKHKIPLWRTMDALVPGLVIAHAFGRFGCLSAGCCYGKPTGSNTGLNSIRSSSTNPCKASLCTRPSSTKLSLCLFYSGDCSRF